MASPREIIDANRPAKGYFTPKDLVGDELEILNEFEFLDSDYADDGKRMHIQVRLDDGTQVTLQPSKGLETGDIMPLAENGGLPVRCKIGTYPTKFGEGYRLVFPGEEDY